MLNTPETEVATWMAGGFFTSDVSPLMTDAYKFSMAQAGFPLRTETFVLSFRKGGPLYVPFDYAAVVKALLPREANAGERTFLHAYGFGMTPAMEEALASGDKLEIWAAPKGSWVNPGEPVLTITGPSFLVSWLEPLCIAFNFQLQIATALKQGVAFFSATCTPEQELIRVVAYSMGAACIVDVLHSHYTDAVSARAQAVVSAVGGDAERVFEVGLRAMSCYPMHAFCLAACSKAGISKTSSLLGAFQYGLQPVGTAGHEHPERWGGDLASFRALRDMRSTPPSYLFDTFSAFESGIPALTQAIAEAPGRKVGVRFDSGDQDAQLRAILQAVGITPTFTFESDYTAERTITNEQVCDALGVPPQQRFYGYGSYLVNAAEWQAFGRNKVSAVYKLSESLGPRMKFAGTKSSTPGKPCTWVNDDGKVRVVAQQGEPPAPGFHALTSADPKFDGYRLELSPQTFDLVKQVAETSGVSEDTLASALGRYAERSF